MATRHAAILLACTAICLTVLAAVSPDPVAGAPAQTTQTFDAVADAFVRSGVPGENSGTGNQLVVGYDGEEIRRALVQFDLDDIPSGASIQSAELRLFVYQADANFPDGVRILARRVSGNWTENGVNWDNQPNSQSPQAGEDAPGSLGWVEWNVRSTVQGWVNGQNTNRGFLLRADAEDEIPTRTFAAREAPPPIQPPTYKPKLVVTWSIVTPTPSSTRTVTPTPSSTPTPTNTPTPTPTPIVDPGYRDVGIVRIWADAFAMDGTATVANGHVRLGSAGQAPPPLDWRERIGRWFGQGPDQPVAQSYYTAGDGTRWPPAGPIDIAGQLAFEANANPLIESKGPGTLTAAPATGKVTMAAAAPLIEKMGNTELKITPTIDLTVVQPVALIKADVAISLPENEGATAHVEYEIDDQDGFTAKSSIDLNLTVAGGMLSIKQLQPALDGIKANSADWKLVSPAITVGVRNVIIDADAGGVPRLSFDGAASFPLPDVDLGDGVFILKKLKGSLKVVQPAGGGAFKYEIALTGELELNLPKNRGLTVEFDRLAFQDGKVAGKINTSLQINLWGQKDLELGPFSFDAQVIADVAGANVAAGAADPAAPTAFRYKLLPEWTQWDLSKPFGLPAKTMLVDANDVALTTAAPFIIFGGDITGAFSWPGPIKLGPSPAVVAFKAIKGLLTYNPNSDSWKMGWITTVEFNLDEVSTVANWKIDIDENGAKGSIASMTVGVTGLKLVLNEVDFSKDTFRATTGSLTLPATWGGDAFALRNVRIGPDGLLVDGAGGEVDLPDRKVGQVMQLTKLRAKVMFANTADQKTTYTLGISGTLTVAVSEVSSAGASFSGSFRDGRFRGQVDGINFQVSGFGFRVDHGDFEGDEIHAELVQMKVPAAFLKGRGGPLTVELHNLVVGGPKGFSFSGGEVAIPDFGYQSVGFQSVRIRFEQAGDGKFRIAGSAKIDLDLFAVAGTFTVVYKPPSNIDVEQVSIAFTGSVNQGTAVTIIPGALYLTEVRGGFDLRHDQVKIQYGGTLAGPIELLGIPVYSSNFDSTVTLDPCCKYAYVGTSKILILEVERTEIEVGSNPPYVRMEREARLPDYLTKVTVSLTIGTDKNDKFTVWGGLRASVGFDKGDFGTYLGAPIPPRNVNLAEADLKTGKFHKDGGGTRWGARLKFNVAGIGLYAFYNYETGNIRGGLKKNNPYEGIPVETRLAQAETQRFKYTIGPASQIVVAEQITTTSRTGEFGLRLEPPGGGAPFAPTRAYSDTVVTLYVVDNPAPGEWIATVPRGNALAFTGLEPDPVVSELAVLPGGPPYELRWDIDGIGVEPTVRLSAVDSAGHTFAIAEDLDPAGQFTWVPTVPNGSYTIQLEGGPEDQPVSAAAPQTVEVLDVTPPAPPANLATTVGPDGAVSVTWSGQYMEPDVVGYRVTLDGQPQPVLSQRVTEHTVSGLAPGGTYNIAVWAYDIAGNEGAASTVSVTLPRLIIEAIYPAPGSTGRLTPEVSISFNSPVETMDLWVTGPDGAAAPGRFQFLRGGSADAIYGKQYIADGVWKSGTYSARIEATTLDGESVAYTWSWSGGRYPILLPYAHR